MKPKDTEKSLVVGMTAVTAATVGIWVVLVGIAFFSLWNLRQLPNVGPVQPTVPVLDQDKINTLSTLKKNELEVLPISRAEPFD